MIYDDVGEIDCETFNYIMEYHAGIYLMGASFIRQCNGVHATNIDGCWDQSFNNMLVVHLACSQVIVPEIMG